MELDSPVPPEQPPHPQPAPPRRGPGPHDLRHRVCALQRELERAYRALLQRRRVESGAKAPPREDLRKLTLELFPPGMRGHSPGQLFEQLSRAAERQVSRSTPIPQGGVYCHWCRTFHCEHATPPEPRCVFGGYSPTGQPLWPELVSVLLARKHPGVDTIFHESPAVVTVLSTEDELTSEQLPVYGRGSPVFRVLGQVALGYVIFPEGLSLPRGPGAHRTPLALTIQAVESHGGGIVLNVVGRLPDATPALQALEESMDSRLGDAVHAARRALDEIGLRRSSRRGRAEERRRLVLGQLHRLEKNLERIFRQRERRTQHARERHTDRQRPAASALRDALEASPASIFRDVEERTWVVIGPRNRVHIFNDQALHVTSIVYPGETVKARTTRGKWRSPPQLEREAFQAALRSKVEER